MPRRAENAGASGTSTGQLAETAAITLENDVSQPAIKHPAQSR